MNEWSSSVSRNKMIRADDINVAAEKHTKFPSENSCERKSVSIFSRARYFLCSLAVWRNKVDGADFWLYCRKRENNKLTKSNDTNPAKS